MDKVRVGFIGAGWWVTTNHMPILRKRDDVEMVGVCRLGADLLQTIKEKFGLQFATEDYRELLEQDLDAVIVGSPHDLHYEHALAALEKGCHVMCEKPMTLNPAQAWDLVNAAQSRGLHLLVPYGWHYKPFIQQAKALMEQGIVGQIEYVLCHMASPTKDFFAGGGSVPTQWTPTLSAPAPSTWQDKAKGGGYGHGQVTHSSALMFWLTGLRAKEVSARMSSPNSGVDMYNTATVAFENGAIGTISGAATLPDNDKFQVDIRVFGTEGVLLLDVERERLEVRRHDGQHEHFDVPSGQGAYTCDEPPEQFIDLILGKTSSNPSPGEVAARSVEMISAMYQSAANAGQPTPVYRAE
ncbi:MAG: Gfo/Idh/MocA family oxidoreductase [Burkholderiales bacterium]|nr:Gfo/Idh/MocA family oxidoreductase [Anaerolineae bacterium]